MTSAFFSMVLMVSRITLPRSAWILATLALGRMMEGVSWYLNALQLLLHHDSLLLMRYWTLLTTLQYSRTLCCHFQKRILQKIGAFSKTMLQHTLLTKLKRSSRALMSMFKTGHLEIQISTQLSIS